MRKKKNDKLWEKHNKNWQQREAMFLDWVQLKALLEYRLNDLLGRDIKPIPFQDSDYWDVYTQEYTQEELEKLFSAANADAEDRKNHGLDYEGKLHSLTSDFTTKLLSPEFPFEIDKSVVTEQGIYFLGVSKEYIKEYIKEYK